jgi:hypothetical protein
MGGYGPGMAAIAILCLTAILALAAATRSTHHASGSR